MNAVLLISVLGALVAVIAAAGLRRVPEGTVCTVHRFGRFVRAIGPGLHFCWPLIDRIAHRVSMIGHEVVLSLGDGPTATVYFQILEPERAGEVLERVDSMVEREARSRLHALAADAERGSLAARLKQELNARLGDLGLRVTRCQLRGA